MMIALRFAPAALAFALLLTRHLPQPVRPRPKIAHLHRPLHTPVQAQAQHPSLRCPSTRVPLGAPTPNADRRGRDQRQFPRWRGYGCPMDPEIGRFPRHACGRLSEDQTGWNLFRGAYVCPVSKIKTCFPLRLSTFLSPLTTYPPPLRLESPRCKSSPAPSDPARSCPIQKAGRSAVRHSSSLHWEPNCSTRQDRKREIRSRCNRCIVTSRRDRYRRGSSCSLVAISVRVAPARRGYI